MADDPLNIGGQKGNQTKGNKLFGKETVSGLKEVKDFSKTIASSAKEMKGMNTTAKAMFSSIAGVEEGLSNSALYSEKNKKSHAGLAKEAEKMVGKGKVGLMLQKLGLGIKEKMFKQDHGMAKSMIDQLQNIRKQVPIRQKIMDTMGKMKDKVKGMKGGAKELDNIFGGIGQKIAKLILSPWGLLLGMIAFAVKMFMRFSKVTDMIGEDFGYMANEGGKLNKEVMKLNAEGAHLDVNYDKFKQHIDGIASGMGVSAIEAVNLAAQSEKLGIALGIGGGNAAKLKADFHMIAGLAKETTDDYLKQAVALAEQAGVVPSVVMKDVANSSEMMAKYTKDGGKNILTAAINAKKFGVNLSTVEKITDSLLDIESSINKEFEASVMIGKQLNFQTARQKALQGDVSGAMADVVSQLGGAAEYAKLDVLQRRSLAGAIGVSATELAKFMNKQEEVNDLAKVTTEEMDKQDISDIKAENAISAFTQSQNAAKNLGDQISTGLLPQFTKLAELLGGKDGEGGIVGSIGDIGMKMASWGEQLPFIGAGLAKMSSKFKFLAKGVAGGFKTVMGNVGTALKGAISNMAKGLKTGIGALLSKGSTMFKGMGSMLKGSAKFLKKIPVLGSVVGVASGVSRAVQGDWAGAGMEFASAGANALNIVAPGVGTAASLAIDAALIARDAGMWGNIPGQPAEDFIMRPGQPPLKFSKGDIVTGMHESSGGAGNMGSNDDDFIDRLADKIGQNFVHAFNSTEQQTIVTKEQIKQITTMTV